MVSKSSSSVPQRPGRSITAFLPVSIRCLRSRVLHDLQFCELTVRPLELLHKSRHDADDATTISQSAVGHLSHQSECPPPYTISMELRARISRNRNAARMYSGSQEHHSMSLAASARMCLVALNTGARFVRTTDELCKSFFRISCLH